MRWKLLRRRLSVSAPRVSVRSHLPWPLRWLSAALMLGLSAAVGLWAFEFGKEIAGLDQGARQERRDLRDALEQAREDRDKAQSLANTADTLLKAERVTQEKLNQQVKQLEAEVQAMRADLGFYERLIPGGGAAGQGLQVRGLSLDPDAEPGRRKLQVMLMQPGSAPAEWHGQFSVQVQGVLDGKPWQSAWLAQQPIQIKQLRRIESLLELPPSLAAKQVVVRVTDAGGNNKLTHTAKL